MQVDFEVKEITRTAYSQAVRGEVVTVIMYPLLASPGSTDGSVKLEIQDLELAGKIDLGSVFSLRSQP